MRKVLFIAAASLALAGCVTSDAGVRTLDRQRICETSLRITQTVAGIAAVLELNGIDAVSAQGIALTAIASGETVAVVCSVLAANELRLASPPPVPHQH